MKRELEGGLILRTLGEGHASDRERLPQFYYDVFREAEGEEEAAGLIPWTQDLLTNHPTMQPDDFVVVVDPAEDDKIVSATLLLLHHNMRYEDVEFRAGQPEIVATDKAYRRRGLVREVFQAIHERSEGHHGHLVQFIGGIEYFYRQFGYTMAVPLGSGYTLPLDAIKDREDDETPDYTLRRATHADIPAMQDIQRFYGDGLLLSSVRTADYFKYDIDGRSDTSGIDSHMLVIVNQAGEVVGYLPVQKMNSKERLGISIVAVGEKASYLAVYEDVIRGLKAFAAELHPEKPPQHVAFEHGIHPALGQLVESTWLGAKRPSPYAWYMRVPDLSAFLRKIAPVLERRLIGSGAHGYTGDLNIGFFQREYLQMTFDSGKLTEVSLKPQPDDDNKLHAVFPYLTFLNLVFGHHTMDELTHILPDARAGRTGKILLSALFPKKPSSLWMMG